MCIVQYSTPNTFLLLYLYQLISNNLSVKILIGFIVYLVSSILQEYVGISFFTRGIKIKLKMNIQN